MRNNIWKELKRLIPLTYETYKTFGISTLLKEIKRYILHGPIIEGESKNKTKKNLKTLKIKPKISIITSVFNIKPFLLDATIQSVIGQNYTNWELCLYDDCSTEGKTLDCLQRWTEKDDRIKIQHGTNKKNISFASNNAIKMANGDFIGLLDSGDLLTPFTLLEIVKKVNEDNKVDFIYTDEDHIDSSEIYFKPHYKSDFNRSLLLSYNYISHFSVTRKDLGDKLGWFREDFDGAHEYDLFLRIIEKTNNILHIPRILYHCRQFSNNVSLKLNENSNEDIAARKALLDYSKRNCIEADIINGPELFTYRLKRKIITDKKVSIIIPFKDQVNYLRECVNSILEKTSYNNFEILLISNNSIEAETYDYLEIVKNNPRIRIMEYNVPFNYSIINNWGVKQAKGDYILLLNNDIKVISDEWMEAMLEHIQMDSVGIVGAKLLYEDNTIQHAGVIIGLGGVAGHSHKFLPDNRLGYFNRASVVQNLSAVTGACLLTKKEIWLKVGGLDEINFKIAFNDIDYCLKVRSLGYEIIYTPYAKLYHYESLSRGFEDTPEKQMRFSSECQMMVQKWNTRVIPDPFYNINLTLDAEDFSFKNI